MTQGEKKHVYKRLLLSDGLFAFNWLLIEFDSIFTLIALKLTLLKRKCNSQHNQYLSFFSKSCMEKSCALSHWMILKIWLTGYHLIQFVRCIVQLSVHLFHLSFIINKIIVIMIIFIIILIINLIM